MDLVVDRIIKAYRELANDSSKTSKSLKRGPIFHPNSPWCLFHGSCHGGRMILYFSNQHSLHIQLGAGTGTNTKA